MTLRLMTIVVGMAGVLWSTTPFAHGQKATEVFIPIGQSPGVSYKLTIVGTIERIDPQTRTIAGAAPAGPWSANVTPRTKIWLDRSKLRLTNQKGAFADLRTGLLVEVKYEDPAGRVQGKGPAEWVKVEVPGSGRAGYRETVSGRSRP